jgi:DNA polymerase-3 subunit delta
MGSKLDTRRRLVVLAKKRGFLVECAAPTKNLLPAWVSAAARRREKTLAPGVAGILSELFGSDLSLLDDAVERLALYSGDSPEITEDAVAACIVQVKPSTVWDLTGAVGRRDLGAALEALASVYDAQDRGLRLLGVLAWSTRQMVRFRAAVKQGHSPTEAAQQAGVPPFKASEVAAQVRAIPAGVLEGWLLRLADVDLALKGGSRRPPRAVLEEALAAMCRPATRRPQRGAVRA